MSPRLLRTRFLLVSLYLLPCVVESQIRLDELAITVTGTSREFAYTNKKDAFFYSETGAGHAKSWQGFHVSRRRVLDDYAILVDGNVLARSEAVRVTVYPDYVVREYANGVREEVRLVDSLAMMAIHLSSPLPVEFGFVPFVPGGRSTTDRVFHMETDRLLVGTGSPSKFWLALNGPGFTPLAKDISRDGKQSDALLYASKAKEGIISIAAAPDSAQADLMAASYHQHALRFADERRARMEALLALTPVQTADPGFDAALCWAKLSLDALIMNDGRKGIYAGLPWFNNYWGRDTFISLPGALLVTGRFAEAKNILRTFAGLQDTDTASSTYGRIPNVVNPGEVSYNTADGTPRFVIMAREYVERSGDTSFFAEIYPSVLRAVDGTIRYHTDSLGFLTHGDAETWMDAVGPDGPWSPRGNRANDVQALWVQQLQAAIWFATQVGDAISAQSWHNFTQPLVDNFRRHFTTGGHIADHLNADGTPDAQIRPNQIFTASLLDDPERASVVRTVTEQLTYPFGVASLSQEDPGFHPFHDHPPLYPKDAAYHNGTVWTWLQGPLISELCRFGRENTAYRLTQNSVNQILRRGAVGTQSELIDAIPYPGETEPQLSGTFSQAWNLAEFIRNFYDDYLGVRLTRFDHTLRIRPRLPDTLGNVSAVINLDGRSVPISVRRTTESFDVTIDAGNLRQRGKTELVLPLGSSGKSGIVTLDIIPGQKLVISASEVGVLLMDKGGTKILPYTPAVVPSHLLPDPLAFALPSYRPDLPALRGPEHTLLPHSIIKESNPDAQILVDLMDEAGDDTGTGAFVYPGHPSHIDGSFDLTRFSVRSDDRNAYFQLRLRALSDPGWHPEFGFQLTCIAIAIDTDGAPGTGATTVENNAGFTFRNGFGYERLVLVGGGIRVEDDEGIILAEYVPSVVDARDPLGNASQGTITFAVPLEYLGNPGSKWRFAVLSGGQDDHGGAGLGEFRSVGYKGSEWSGGGRLSDADPNIYDTLFSP